MSGDNFVISLNKEEYCFNPLVCSTEVGHLIVWAWGVDSEESTLYSHSYPDSTDPEPMALGTINDRDQLLFLNYFSRDKYLLAIETKVGDIRLIFLNSQGKLVEEKTVNVDGVLLYSYQKNDDIVQFIHDYTREEFRVYCGKGWELTSPVHTVRGAYGIPIVVSISEDTYIAAWITDDDDMVVACGDLSGVFMTLTVNNPGVDYLVGSRADKNVVVFGGSCLRTREVKLYYFSTIPEFKLICKRVLNSEQYKNMAITLAGLDRGFFLLGEDEKQERVYMQRFTHLGTYLYLPVISDPDDDECTWSPMLAFGNPNTLLVYIKDYSDYSQVWGKWLNIRRISEIEPLQICDDK